METKELMVASHYEWLLSCGGYRKGRLSKFPRLANIDHFMAESQCCNGIVEG